MLTESKFDFGKWEDLLPVLKDKSFDLVYSDPPFGMEYLSQIPGHGNWCKSGFSTSKFEKKILNDKKDGVAWKDFAVHSYRLLKDNRFLFLHCNLEVVYRHIHWFEEAGFNIKGQVIWDKSFSIGGDLKAAMKRDWEPIVYMAKGKPQFNPIEVMREKKMVLRKRISEIDDWQFQLLDKEKLGFPTQKPLALCTQVVLLTTKPDEWVLDPFTGSGSIPLSAKLCGRHFYACDADQEVYDKFKDRIQ